MTDREMFVYVVECIGLIRDSADLDDGQFVAVCGALGALPPDVLLTIVDMLATMEPAEVADRLAAVPVQPVPDPAATAIRP